MLRSAGRADEARKAIDKLTAAHDELVRDNPQLTWLKATLSVQRSLWVIERVRSGECRDPEAEFQKFLPDTLPQQVPVVRYNLACALAQGVEFGPSANKEENGRKAVALLNELAAGPFFRNPANVSHLDDDTDLDPLRNRADFNKFLAKVHGPAVAP